MKVWKDVFTGDAMVSNDFRYKEIFGGAGLEVIGRIEGAPSVSASFDTTPQVSLRQSAERGTLESMEANLLSET